MSRRRDFELWREVTRTTVGLTGIVELFAKRVGREDRLALAKEMLAHSDGLADSACQPFSLGPMAADRCMSTTARIVAAMGG
jgi:hypothetical protein